MASQMMQNYTKVKKEILNYLFKKYLADGGTKIYNVSDIIVAHGFSLAEVGSYLVQNRWVKNEVFKPKQFYASISIKGIKEIDLPFLDSQFSKIISTLIMNANKTSSVIDILEYEPMDFQIALDISNALEEMGYAEIEIKEDNIFVTLNLKGWNLYSSKKLSNFSNLDDNDISNKPKS